mmetsp:Transcript_17828/g.61554  ORF Transcript_17828/g.61554 Transcript_17828/m.61554 type:complete len:228 (+) Transcript_17828:282-965(+)
MERPSRLVCRVRHCATPPAGRVSASTRAECSTRTALPGGAMRSSSVSAVACAVTCAKAATYDATGCAVPAVTCASRRAAAPGAAFAMASWRPWACAFCWAEKRLSSAANMSCFCMASTASTAWRDDCPVGTCMASAAADAAAKSASYAILYSKYSGPLLDNDFAARARFSAREALWGWKKTERSISAAAMAKFSRAVRERRRGKTREREFSRPWYRTQTTAATSWPR